MTLNSKWQITSEIGPGAHPTNSISIEFEIP